MDTLESLAAALETAGDIRAIVRTMKALSAASIRQCEQAEAAIADFEHTVSLGLSALLRDRRARGLPLPRTAPVRGREALVVIGSDRGLCGPYNENIVRFAAERIDGETALIVVIGARAAARLEAAGHAPDRSFALPGSVGGLTGTVQSVIIGIDRWRQEDGIARVRLMSNRRRGRIEAEPVERPLLPIPDEVLDEMSRADWPGPSLPFHRTQEGRLLSWLVQQRLFVVLYRALAEALASEHATRLSAMQRAEANIEERQDALRAAFRRRRQETITRELLDVVSGFEAIGGSEDGRD